MKKLFVAALFLNLLAVTAMATGGTVLSFSISPRNAFHTGRWASLEKKPKVKRKIIAHASGCKFIKGTTSVRISLFCQVSFKESESTVSTKAMLFPNETTHTAKVGGLLKVPGTKPAPPPPWAVTGMDILDLSIDSDNNNGLDTPDRSKEESDIEDAPPGKFIVTNSSDLDHDGIPDFADGFNKFKKISDDDTVKGVSSMPFVPLVLEVNANQLKNNSAKITFIYKASSPRKVKKEKIGTDADGTPIFSYKAPPGFRIWKTKANSRNKKSVKKGGDYIPNGTALTLAELGMPDGGTKTFFVEALPGSETFYTPKIVARITGKAHTDDYITQRDKVRLSAVPGVEIDSKDRMFHASFVLPNNITDASFSVTNKQNGQTFGTYSLTSPSSDTYIYNSEDDIFSDNEMSLEESGMLDDNIKYQKVVIIKDKNTPHKYHIYGIFDVAGEMSFNLTLNGKTFTTTHTLYESDFGEWIDFYSYWISGGMEPPPLLMAAAKPPRTTKKFTQTNNFTAKIVQYRGMVAKALINIFKRKITPPIMAVKGFFSGIMDGLNDDWDCLKNIAFELKKWFNDPYRRAGEIYNAASELISMQTLRNLPKMIDNMVGAACSRADAALPWHLDIVFDTKAKIYFHSAYVLGYATEQLAVAAVGAGIAAKIGKVMKTLIIASKVGQVALKGISAAKKFIMPFTKFTSMSHEMVDKIRPILNNLRKLKIPRSTKTYAEFLGERYKIWGDKIATLNNIVKKQQFRLYAEQACKDLAYATEKLGPKITNRFSPKACRGFIKIDKYLILTENDSRIADLVKLFTKKNGKLDKKALNRCLELAENLDAGIGKKPHFKLGEEFAKTHKKSYRYFDSKKRLNHKPYNGQTFLEYHIKKRM